MASVGSQEEIERLRLALEKANARIEQLEEECDLLAEDNARLRQEMDDLRFNPRPTEAVINRKIEEQLESSTSSRVDVADVDVFVEGDGKFAQQANLTISDASSGKNVLCTSIFTTQDPDTMGDVVFCGGVDGYLRGYNMKSGVEVYVHRLTGPVLSIACHPPFLACSVMDGTHIIAHIDPETAELCVASFRDHSKYVVAVCWNADGSLLATASHDKTVNLYRRKDINPAASSSASAAAVEEQSMNAAESFEKYRSIQFENTPESIVFDGSELIIGLRGLVHLLYVHMETFVQRAVSLNENDWDTHVSFVPLSLALSPCLRYLLVATDRHMLLVLRRGTNKRVRTLMGHACGDYGKPSVAWDASGSYVYCNSDEERVVYVYDLATQRVAAKLQAHRGIVRGIATHPVTPGVLSSVSYDKSLIVWGCKQ